MLGPLDAPVKDWGHYRMIRLLGMGGMGRTYLAMDEKLQRHVAVKFLNERHPEWVKRFIGEARAQSLVEHECVCKVYEAGETCGQPYIAMQFIDGKTLGQASDELSLKQKLRVIQRVAEGIHEAHRVGLLHRDIKPDNIMVTQTSDGEARPYIMDFGLARNMGEARQTESGALLGTLHYMPPEQARGDRSLDRRGDVYSLGATLYKILTGKPPIEGDGDLAILTRILSHEPKRPSLLNRKIPADVETIALKCLEKDPDRRYDSARALAQDLKRFLGGELISARPASLLYRVRKWMARRRRLLAIAAPALLAAALSLGWLAYNQWQSAVQERLTREVTRHAEKVETIARSSQLSPPHPLGAMRAMAVVELEEMAAVRARLQELKPGLGAYAMARAHLAIGEPDRARAYLDEAWRLGNREARVSYGMARVLGRLSQEALARVLALPEPELRAAAAATADQLREQALDWLAPALDQFPQAQPLAAYCAGPQGAGEAVEASSASSAPWEHEALAWRGFSQARQALALESRGDVEAARNGYASALETWREALTIAPSNALLRRAEASVCLALGYVGEADRLALAARGAKAAESAVTLEPGNVESLVLSAHAHRRWSAALRAADMDAGAALARAERDLAAAERLSEHPAVKLERALSALECAAWLGGPGDTAPLLQGLYALSEIKPSDRGYLYFETRGRILMALAGDERLEPARRRDLVQHAVLALRTAVDANGGVAAARELLRRCLSMNP